MLASLLAVGCGGDNDAEDRGAPAATHGTQPLSDSGFRVEWVSNDLPPALHPGEAKKVQVEVRNKSDQTWPDLIAWIPTAAPAGDPRANRPASQVAAVRLSHRWWESDIRKPIGDWIGRVELPRPLAPGESAVLSVKITAPSKPGSYKIQFDLVQENVSWFEDKGASKLILPVEVK